MNQTYYSFYLRFRVTLIMMTHPKSSCLHYENEGMLPSS